METIVAILGILNLTELAGFITAIVLLKSNLQKAKEEVNQSKEETRSATVDNDEHVLKMVMEFLVSPLKTEIVGLRREVAGLKRAIQKANTCKYHDECPVISTMQAQENEGKESNDVL